MKRINAQKSSVSHDICLIILTLLFVFSVYIFVTVLSHNSLYSSQWKSDELGRNIFVNNIVSKWEVSGRNCANTTIRVAEIGTICLNVIVILYVEMIKLYFYKLEWKTVRICYSWGDHL